MTISLVWARLDFVLLCASVKLSLLRTQQLRKVERTDAAVVFADISGPLE